MSPTKKQIKSVRKKDRIIVQGARVNNLKNISVDMPREALVVITGLSGSGKSSLAFDTIYAEGNRRYMESLSSYARSFLDVNAKPDVDKIENIGPSISIDQKSVARSPRSTVGTMTEIYDYLRVLFAKVGAVHCSHCDVPMRRTTNTEILDMIIALPQGTKLALLAPVSDENRTVTEILHTAQQWGYARVRFNEKVMTISEAFLIADDTVPMRVDIVIDRMDITRDAIDRERIIDSIETAMKIGKGSMIVSYDGNDKQHNHDYKCSNCGETVQNIRPHHFSFNHPKGACPECSGLGIKSEIDPEKLIPNKKLSLAEGAIHIWSKSSGKMGDESQRTDALAVLAKRYKFSLKMPVKDLSKAHLAIVLYGVPNELQKDSTHDLDSARITKLFRGVIPELEEKYKATRSDYLRNEIEKYMTMQTCPGCEGKRLTQQSLHVTIDERSIDDIINLSLTECKNYCKNITKGDRLSDEKRKISLPLFREIIVRLESLEGVGVEYLSLGRSTETLSGGEAQRIRLAIQIKSELMGVVYVLDEPTVGLHARDTKKLVSTLTALQEAGNSLIVVEHDRDLMKAADWIIDMGPGAGDDGGVVMFSGTLQELKKSKTTTAPYITGKKKVSSKKSYRKGSKKNIEIVKASEHNLKDISVKIPLETLVAVAGVSGSGKSTLVNDILARVLAKEFHGAQKEPGAHKTVKGLSAINKVISINQLPIGRTPRSNAATYTGVFAHIRELFAATDDARDRGYTASRFSFNMRGGRCEVCQGDGLRKVEMYLLPDIYVACEACVGSRYNEKTLEIEYNGVTIAEVLDMSVSYAAAFFKSHTLISEKLRTMEDVGLGYLCLGQSATNLSGGEAQRIKLATELARKATGKTLYVLDEPTVGLHFDDTKRLLGVLDALVDKGNTVLVVEHNTDVITHADWVIELGPDGGDGGGEIVFEGTPKKMKSCKKSPTAKFL